MNYDNIILELYDKYINEELIECVLCGIKLPINNFHYLNCNHGYCQYCCIKIINNKSICPCCLKMDYGIRQTIKNSNSLGEKYFKKAMELYQLGKIDDAILFFKKSGTYGSIKSFNGLAFCYLFNNKFDEYIKYTIHYLLKSTYDTKKKDIVYSALLLSYHFSKNNIDYAIFFNNKMNEYLKHIKNNEITDPLYSLKKINVFMNGYLKKKLSNKIRDYYDFLKYENNKIDIININDINTSIKEILDNIKYNNNNIQSYIKELCDIYFYVKKYFIVNTKENKIDNHTLKNNILIFYIDFIKLFTNDDKLKIEITDTVYLQKIINIYCELNLIAQKNKISNNNENLYFISQALSLLYSLKSVEYMNISNNIKINNKRKIKDI